MGISTLMSAAHAAGYAMGVPEDLHEECETTTSDAPLPREHVAPAAEPAKANVGLGNWLNLPNMREWVLSWSGRAHA
jgi:hypothetical protein